MLPGEEDWETREMEKENQKDHVFILWGTV